MNESTRIFQEIKKHFAVESIAKRNPINFDYYKKKFIVYCIINIVSGKIYVGSTTNLARRVYNYIYDYLSTNTHRQPIIEDMINTGINNFIMAPIEIVDSRADMRIREAWWIRSLGTTNPNRGYNETIPEDHNEGHFSGRSKAARSKHIAAINPDVKHLVISEGLKLFADYTYSTKDLVKNEARNCVKHRGYYIIYLNEKDRNQMYEKAYEKWLEMQNEGLHTRSKSGEYIAAADLINDMLESESVEILESSGYKCEYLHYDLSNEKPCLMDPISVFFDTVDLSQFDGIKDTNEET